jgi:MFS transporter, DHA1 family, multidrug resistance protein
MSPVVIVVLLTLLLGIQPVATDLYLPALPTLQHELGAGIAPAQLTLSALIIAFGVSQLIAGPLSDRFGRRPVLLWGTALYTIACTGGALAPDIESLIAWRALQGVAIATAVTSGRSVVRDLFRPIDGAKTMSRALGGLGVIAMVAPLVGGLLVHLLGWRSALAAPALFGAATFGFVAWKFVETIPVRNADALRLAPLAADWRAILAHPTFRAWVGLLSCTYGGLFVFLMASSTVIIQQRGASRLIYGAMLSTIALSYITGTVWCRRLLVRYGMAGAVRRASWFSLVGGLSLIALDIAGARSIWAVLLPQVIFMIGHGVHQSCGQAGAIGPFPEKAGAASALTGFLMMSVAFAAGVALGPLMHGESWPMTAGIALFSVLVAVIAQTAIQRYGEVDAQLPRRVAAADGKLET